MFLNLFQLSSNIALVDGVKSENGWGEYIRNHILPLLNHQKLKHHKGIIMDGFDRFNQPISIFVIGEGNYGKSTVINALRGNGEEIAKTNFLPLTWHITRYIPSKDQTRYEIYYDTSLLEANQFEQTCQTIGAKIDGDKGIVYFDTLDKLENVLQQQEEAKNTQRQQSPIWQVVRTFNSPETAGVYELIDTPGIAQTRFGSASSESIDDFYHRADVVVWLIDSQRLNSQQTKKYLTSMSRYGKPIIGVINKADMIPEGQKPEVINKVTQEFGYLLNDIVLISARDAFNALKNQDEELLLNSGLPELRASIDDLVSSGGQITQAYSIYNTAKQAAKEAASILSQEADVLERNVALYKENCTLASNYTPKAKEAIKARLGNATNLIKSNAEQFMRQTADTTSLNQNVPVIDEDAVKQNIQESCFTVTNQIKDVLITQLQSTQTEIIARSYDEQNYSANAKVQSHQGKTSFSIKNHNIASNLTLPVIKPQFSFVDFLKGIGGLLLDIGRWAFGIQKTPQEINDEIRQKRRDCLEAYVRGLTQVAEECKAEMEKNINSCINITTNSLLKEVEDCFAKEFGGVESALQVAKSHRQKAQKAIAPPPLIYTITQILQSQLC